MTDFLHHPGPPTKPQLITDADAVENKDALDDAYDQLDDAGNSTARGEVAFLQFFYYKSRSGKNVFTPENLKVCDAQCERREAMFTGKALSHKSPSLLGALVHPRPVPPRPCP